MSTTIYQVDAFTTKPFSGNPAGVCILEKEPSPVWMQNVAMEINASETAFVFPVNGTITIRFYTPESEIDLCGHATLSASHIFYETGLAKPGEELNLLSKAGMLGIRRSGDWITMNFPAYPLEPLPITDLFHSLTGVTPLELYKSVFGWTLALVSSEEELRGMAPDFNSMKRSEFGDLIVTAPSSDGNFDFCVRCFVPGLGINEDPVTGSAHCALVPFWNSKTGKKEFISHQVSKREGILKVALRGDRVEISGQAITILKAELMV